MSISIQKEINVVLRKMGLYLMQKKTKIRQLKYV